MQLIDPTVTSPQQSNKRAPALKSLEGIRIGLLSNRKINADLLLHETAALFAERHGCSVLGMRSKNNASAPAPAKTIESLANECDVLITANGD
jgi:hypothetical protein